MTKPSGFIERHGLWGDEQRRQASEIEQRVDRDGLQLVRLAWADPHGVARAKAVTPEALSGAFRDGYNINVATTTLDSANARVFSSFTRGGGMGLDEMTGSPNLVAVPDPATFRVLPWAEGVGWMLCDEYFGNGVPFHFSPRQLLKKVLGRLAERKLEAVVGLEIEWYLLRVAQDHLTDENTGLPGLRARPIATSAAEPGFSYHSESNMDLMQPVLSALAKGYRQVGLPLRSIENEWGPGQLECTFAARPALEAADHAVLFRTATRQMCRRMGHLATFMCRPASKGYYSSGWHLHQSLVERGSGRNLLMPTDAAEPLSPLGRAWLAGLLRHAAGSTVFATPTVNGYRRYRPSSLAPDRATWCRDHRGVMLRVLGAPGDPATRIENRLGEPSANPYLYVLSQIIAGLAGIDGGLDPGPPDDEPYAAERPRLPTSLPEALDALECEPLFRTALGEIFIDYYLALKRSEASRYTQWRARTGTPPGEETTEWEQNEYFDFF